ncbi:hypothetical protein [Streptomyces sp. ST2-7A]|uniref:hypothetical protein n=1 Tax=Streptomyces sp. ST2-7A TaxID=2907214 RepID=UPI001F15E4FF|nr:hypothetical protein [Streptomyces sp. ST2-7A]MCE7081161.1 hypothetical protein [Streptomyces sp. ST2-7A]
MTTPATVVEIPTAELAAVAWLKTIPAIGHGHAATRLPRDTESWADTGFVVVEADVAGPQNPHVPWHESVLQLACYGANPDRLTPNWARSGRLAQLVIEASLQDWALNELLPVRTGGPRVRITGAWPQTTPRRDTEDPSDYAVHRLDLALHWAQVDTPNLIGEPES